MLGDEVAMTVISLKSPGESLERFWGYVLGGVNASLAFVSILAFRIEKICCTRVKCSEKPNTIIQSSSNPHHHHHHHRKKLSSHIDHSDFLFLTPWAAQ